MCSFIFSVTLHLYSNYHNFLNQHCIDVRGIVVIVIVYYPLNSIESMMIVIKPEYEILV